MTTGNPQQEPYRLTEQIEIDLASLAMQERGYIDLTGGLFPERGNDFRGLARVIDIACGTGHWAVSVARENPQLEVIGIAHQIRLAKYAEGVAEAQGVENAHFLLLTGGMRPTLPFVDNYFDLVHTQYLYAWLRTEEWPDFLKECWRVTGPGGYLHMTEPEWDVASSPSLAQVRRLFLQAMKKAGLLLTQDDSDVGAATHLRRFCEDAGWQQVIERSYITDYATGSYMPMDPTLRVEILARSFRPLILAQGIAGEEEMTKLMKEMSEEMACDDFKVKRIWTVICARKLVSELKPV